MIEALSVQLPEISGRELVEVAPQIANFQPVRMGFVAGLIWRTPRSITSKTREYINQQVVRYPDSFEALLDVFLTLAPIPGHPYNADFLHEILIKQAMAERDAWWSAYLHRQYGTGGAIDRLVEWTRSKESKGQIAEESIRPYATALSWFLTTSNRFLRDRATKALVALLTPHIAILRGVLEKFAGVDDLYVLERLFAVAYGCAMRSTDVSAVTELAKDVYRLIFKEGTPVPHILLRDYARGVIEVALHRGAKLRISRKKIRPPYGSAWPTEIPGEQELKGYKKSWDGMPDVEWSRVAIYDSVMDFGDFAHYVMGSQRFLWLERRLGAPPGPTSEEIYGKFLQSLTARQRQLWVKFLQVRDGTLVPDAFSQSDSSTHDYHSPNVDLRAVRRAYTKFEKALGEKKGELLRQNASLFLENLLLQEQEDEKAFDLSLIQRWILKRVFDLGWTVDRFGAFDRDVNGQGYERSGPKPERIGKKYQWLAWHEILARLSDNFEYNGDRWNSELRERRYDGPWQTHARDIDPSCQLAGGEGSAERKYLPPTWWAPTNYEGWPPPGDDLGWLQNGGDLPPVEPLIQVTRPDGSQWLVLETYLSWEKPVPLEEDPEEHPRREVWYQLRSYIARRDDIEVLFEWAKKQDFVGRWMPESHHSHSVFLGEFFWAPAFRYHDNPYYRREGWTNGEGRLPRRVLIPMDGYLGEGGSYDGSLDESVAVSLPAKWLVEKAGLHWKGVDGSFYDEKGLLIACDPSVEGLGPRALLLRRDSLLSVLAENEYDIFWTVLGEKQSIPKGLGGRISGRIKRWQEINGAYRLKDGKLNGVLRSTFKTAESQSNRPRRTPRSRSVKPG